MKKKTASKSGFWSLQEIVQVTDYKDFKKPDVWKKLLAHKSSFWSLQEVVQVADYKNSENLIKPR